MGKGQLNEQIWAIMTSLVLVFGTLVIAFPVQEADADHSIATGEIRIFKGSVHFATFPSSDVSCGVTCNVSIDLPKRFEALFKRDCASSTFSVILPADTQNSATLCIDAKGPWGIEVVVGLDDTHNSAVTVNVIAT